MSDSDEPADEPANVIQAETAEPAAEPANVIQAEPAAEPALISQPVESVAFAVPAAPSLQRSKKRSKKSVAVEKPSSVEVLRIECKVLKLT